MAGTPRVSARTSAAASRIFSRDGHHSTGSGSFTIRIEGTSGGADGATVVLVTVSSPAREGAFGEFTFGSAAVTVGLSIELAGLFSRGGIVAGPIDCGDWSFGPTGSELGFNGVAVAPTRSPPPHVNEGACCVAVGGALAAPLEFTPPVGAGCGPCAGVESRLVSLLSSLPPVLPFPPSLPPMRALSDGVISAFTTLQKRPVAMAHRRIMPKRCVKVFNRTNDKPYFTLIKFAAFEMG